MSTVYPRRTIFDDVSLAVERSGEEPQLVSSGCSTVWTEKAPAEDTQAPAEDTPRPVSS